ncbi:molybdopterin-dependent oxidoreductase [Chitinimonas sp. DQS-5]|uniref:Molybdopterin-dependent oxidoreductase n=2 Tax=Parachitinimonas caeni TaxID=3031301 RepID=A0ABT7DTJ4_9NEIS|nr:molybdopterin-dependent oxidoreductase [Parachitinimonas caeni]
MKILYKAIGSALTLALLWCQTSISALAATPAVPVLTIKVKQGGNESVQTLDMKALEAMPQHSFVTHTPWYPKPIKFTGPLLRTVLATNKLTGQVLKATAINDYTIDIPIEDARTYDVIVARLMDDKPMSPRDRGPLFVIYPFDSHPKTLATQFRERSIWQLKELRVE